MNGDGKMDISDEWGLLSADGAQNGTIIHCIGAADIRYTERQSDGGVKVLPLSEKMQLVFDKVTAAVKNTNCARSYEEFGKTVDITGYAHIYNYCRAKYAEGHFLFVQNGMTGQFADMKDDYGIVPMPKYDANQENYTAKVDRFALIFGIPVSAPDLQQAAAVMEYGSWLSKTTLLPAYFDITVKIKRTRDEKAEAMLDIIKGSLTYEICDIFDIGVSEIIYDGYTSGNLSSAWASRIESAQTKLDSLAEKIKNLK